jgi:hypothetical protein
MPMGMASVLAFAPFGEEVGLEAESGGLLGLQAIASAKEIAAATSAVMSGLRRIFSIVCLKNYGDFTIIKGK